MLFKGFSKFSSGGHFVEGRGATLAISVKGHPRNISLKLVSNWAIGLQGDAVQRFSHC